MYNIVHYYTGHSQPLEEFENREEAIAVFYEIVKGWGEPDPSDEFLELYWFDEETYDMEEEICYHEFTDPNTWSDD